MVEGIMAVVCFGIMILSVVVYIGKPISGLIKGHNGLKTVVRGLMTVVIYFVCSYAWTHTMLVIADVAGDTGGDAVVDIVLSPLVYELPSWIMAFKLFMKWLKSPDKIKVAYESGAVQTQPGQSAFNKLETIVSNIKSLAEEPQQQNTVIIEQSQHTVQPQQVQYEQYQQIAQQQQQQPVQPVQYQQSVEQQPAQQTAPVEPKPQQVQYHQSQNPQPAKEDRGFSLSDFE